MAAEYEDLSFVLHGIPDPPEAELAERLDGIGSIYYGEPQMIFAEPEAGKTWYGLWVIREHMARGGHVVYLDYEMSAEQVARYLMYLGTEPADIIEKLHYVLDAYGEEVDEYIEDARERIEAGENVLVFIDSWDECLGGLDVPDPNSQAAGTVMARRILRPIKKSGGTTLIIDHATTLARNKKRGSAGSFRKLAAVEVAIELIVIQQPRPGGHGRMSMRIAKDRPGFLRAHSKTERTSSGKLEDWFGTLHLDSEADPQKVRMWIEPDAFVPRGIAGTDYAGLILGFLNERPAKRAEVQEYLAEKVSNVGDSAAKTQLGKLRDRGLVQYDSREYRWSLTDEGGAELLRRLEEPPTDRDSSGTPDGVDDSTDQDLDDYAA